MQTRSPLAFLIVALVGSFAAGAANAQPPGPPPHPPGAEEHARHWMFSPADRAAFNDARIAALHAGLKLTPDQEKLWPPIEAALRAGEKSATERREKRRAEPRPADIIARLRQISEAETAHGETLKAIADAAAPLYAGLSDEQKHRLPFLLHAFRRHDLGGHFGGRGEGRDEHGGHHGWRGGDDERDGHASHDDDGEEDEGHHSGRD